MVSRVKAIKGRRNLYAVLSVTVLLLAVLFLVIHQVEMAIACGGLTAAALFLLYRQSRLLNMAMVICDSRILTVPSSVVTSQDRSTKTLAEETVVSTFGLLLGSKIYPWGCEGVNGIRLREVQIDKEHISLCFGADGEMLRVRLLHGLTDSQSVQEIAQKIWHETGVRAEIRD